MAKVISTLFISAPAKVGYDEDKDQVPGGK